MAAAERYLVAGRTASGHAAIAQVLDAPILGEQAEVVRTTPAGRHVVTLTQDAARALARGRRDLIVEEDRPLVLFRMPGLPAVAGVAGDGVGGALVVRAVDTDGQAVGDCSAYAIGAEVALQAITGADGVATFDTTPLGLRRVVVSPRDTYWSVVSELPQGAPDGELGVELVRLGGGTGWARQLLGVGASGLSGAGVTVAVVDSGVTPVDGVDLVDGYNTLDGQDPAAWNVDEKGHGTHCAGIVAAHRTDGAVWGCAPAASVSSLKVFPGGFVSDLVEALEWCVANRIDVVNMSLGSPERSEVLAAAAYDAYLNGVTMIAAAGNDASRVAYPAALPYVIAVSAFGRMGTFPTTSAHALKVGPYRDWFGRLFDANFTNFGEEVDVCAPGIAITSTVPTGLASWDGTSMACPLITGLTALVLEACPQLRSGTSSTPDVIRWALSSAAASLGLPSLLEGTGVPTLPRALDVLARAGLLTATP